jgi:hypothetical protein
METKQETSLSKDVEIHRYDWYIDKKGRVTVVVGFWYENDKKHWVDLLAQGTNSTITPMPLYTIMQEQIRIGNIQLFSANT